MRGKGVCLFLGLPLIGITPACAGKSLVIGRIACEHEDHPRMCGEKHSCDSVGTDA